MEVTGGDSKHSSGRFVHHSKEQIQQKIDESIPVNTKRANIKAGRTFRAFLLDRDGHSPADFENFDVATLNSRLAEFWYGARTLSGNKYSATSLENLRHSLSRYLRSPPFNKQYDIVREKEFMESNEAFKGALRELKEEGKGAVKHHPEIHDTDLQVLYSSFNTSSPAQLQEKVQFDIRFYFFRRGAENMHKMTKSTFEVKTNANGERYICKVVDELNKNHKENCRESYSGYMPESPGSSNCPVASFLLYISHLHPECDALWCRPKANSTSDVWYYNRSVGVDKLRTFMKDLSVKYSLSQVYTNHSIRVTGATILSRKKYTCSQIKEVTGHKSVSSLAVYQRVSDEEKMQMGKSLSETTLGMEKPSTSSSSPESKPEDKVKVVDISAQEIDDIENLLTSAPVDLVVAPSQSQLSQPKSPVRATLQPVDFNLSPYLRDLEMDPNFELQSSSTQVMIQHVSPRPPRQPVFAGCTIHNLTINVHPQQPRP